MTQILSIDYYKKIIKSSPKLYIVHFNLGTAYQELELIDEAINSYKQGIEFQPEFADAYLNLGIYLKILANQMRLLIIFRRANEIDPDNS